MKTPTKTKTQAQPKIDACYCRVSTEMQVEKGQSIEHQKEKLLAYAQYEKLNPIFFIDEGISAKDTRRPQLQKLIEEIKNGCVRTILVTKLDRITRSLDDLLALLRLFEAHDVLFKSLSESFDSSTFMGRGMVKLLGVFAELEREAISDRVSNTMYHRATKGKFNGGVIPYGYMNYAQQVRLNKDKGMSKEEAENAAKELCVSEKKLYVHPGEAKILNEIYDKYLELESLRGVTHWLNTMKYSSRYGTTWAANSVSRVLRSQTYVGKVCYGKRISSKSSSKVKYRQEKEWLIHDAEFEGIIAKDKFERVQKILARQRVEPKRKRSNYILSGLLKCGRCGGGMAGYTHPKKNGKEYSYYKCYSTMQKGVEICQGSNISRPLLEKLIVAQVLNLYKGKELIRLERTVELYNKKNADTLGAPLKEKDVLEKQAEGHERKLKVLLGHLENETITREVYLNRANELQGELRDFKIRIAELAEILKDKAPEPISLEAVLEVVKDIHKVWKGLPYQGKKDLLNSLVSKITITDKHSPVEIDFHFPQSNSIFTHTIKVDFPKPWEKLPEPITLGDHLRLVRLKRGLQVKQLAKQLGFSECIVSLWERGKAHPKQFRMIRRIKEVLPELANLSSKLFYPQLVDNPQSVSDIVKQTRFSLDLSQAEYASHLGAGIHTIVDRERGRIKSAITRNGKAIC